MEIRFDIYYHPIVVKEDIPSLNGLWKSKIKRAIEDKLTVKPEVFGIPLRRSLSNYRKLRVGDYRVIFKIEKQNVKILIIAHRKRVYDQARKRM